jgi:hypothetical protein
VVAKLVSGYFKRLEIGINQPPCAKGDRGDLSKPLEIPLNPPLTKGEFTAQAN